MARRQDSTDTGPRSAVDMATSPPGDTEDWPSAKGGEEHSARTEHANRVLGHDQAPPAGVGQAPDDQQPGGAPVTLGGQPAGVEGGQG